MGCNMCSLFKSNKKEMSAPRNPDKEFPALDESNPRGWLRSCNRYFQRKWIPEHLKMDYVALHVKGNVDHWIEGCMWDHNRMVSWGEFSDKICRKFDLPLITAEEKEEDLRLCKNVHGVEKSNKAIQDLKEQSKEIEEKLVDMDDNTLILLGKVDEKSILILIDTGSTHSFLSPKIAQDMGLECALTAPVPVSTANGDKLICDVICPKFKWTVQGEPFERDIMLLKMGECMGDMVLGMDWVDEFAPVQLDTKPFSISFHKGSRWITLYGILPGVKGVLEKLS